MCFKKYLLFTIILISSPVWATWYPVSGKILNSSSLTMYLVNIQGTYQLSKYPRTPLPPGRTRFAGVVDFEQAVNTSPEVVFWYADSTDPTKVRNQCSVTVEYYGNPSQNPPFTGGIDCGQSPDVVGYTTSACDGSDGPYCNVEIVNK